MQYVEQGDYYQACVWVEGDQRLDWDTASDQELVTLMNNRGYVDCITIEENQNVVFNMGTTETYVWNAGTMQFDHDFDLWANGDRTLATKWFAKQDGTAELLVVEESTGKPISWTEQDGVARLLGLIYPGTADQEFTFDSIADHPEISVADVKPIACFLSDGLNTLDTLTFVDSNGQNNFVMNINEDGQYRDGSAQVPVAPGLYAIMDGSLLLGDYNGRVLRLEDENGYYFGFLVDQNEGLYNIQDIFNSFDGFQPEQLVDISSRREDGIIKFDVNGTQYSVDDSTGLYELSPNNIQQYT